VPIALERGRCWSAAEHELAQEGEVDVADVSGRRMLPLGSPDDGRVSGSSMICAGVERAQRGPVADDIQDMELAVATGEMVIGVPDGMGRTAPNPLVRYVRLRGASHRSSPSPPRGDRPP